MSKQTQPQIQPRDQTIYTEQELPLAVAEVLAAHMEREARHKARHKNTTNLGDYVSDELTPKYPRISPNVYNLTRKVALVPVNVEKILACFRSDVSVEPKQFDQFLDSREYKGMHTTPVIRAVIPLILKARYEKDQTVSIPIKEHPIVHYQIDPQTIPQHCNGRYYGGGFVKLLNAHFGPSRSNNGWGTPFSKTLSIKDQYGALSMEIRGTWVYEEIVESCTVKVPKVPEVASDRIAEAQGQYFSALADAKKEHSKTFTGQTLPQPEINVLWIPTEEQFLVKVKEVPRPVYCPALTLRINKQHEHIVALWDDEKEIPLESIIRKYTK